MLNFRAKISHLDSYKKRLSPLLKAEILEVLELFQASEQVIYNGDRNVLKKIKYKEQELVIKAFRKPNLLNKIVYGNFRKSKAQRSYENGKKLLSIDVPTPQPMGFHETKKGFFFDDSFYISSYLPYDCTMKEVLYEKNFPDAKKIIDLYTDLIYKLHENGMLFIDNTPGNFLIKKNGDGYDIFLVDLNRIYFTGLSLTKRIRNLAKITDDQKKLSWIAKRYALISGANERMIHEMLLKEMNSFQNKLKRKDKIKEKLLLKKQ